MNIPTRAALGALLLVGLACGGDTEAPAAEPPSEAAAETGLSAVEMEQGIGPVRDLELAPLDQTLVEEGEAAFSAKCSACHKMDERYVGPRLGTVLDRRTPEFVMNMILNADEMVKEHPVVQDLLGRFYTPMPVQVREEAEARAILEYLRSARIDSIAASPESGS